ncbi:MAG: group III truncated hemoglobin [Marinovum sp.]|nr:group III truncated hemoglobin [Marinovum sp.]
MAKQPHPRLPIAPADIDQVVVLFYARVRQHPVIGPLFMEAVGTGDSEWAEHEAKIASFWRNAMMIDREYQGNPMRIHIANDAIQPEHFPIWLGLFHETLMDCLDADLAESFFALASRIGRSMAMGIHASRSRPGGPPLLFG